MRYSIVTVCLNAKDTIEKTITSVLEQKKYVDLEYIIIDGKSDDGTVGVIQKYSDNIDYWCSEPDGGIYDAMNRGIRITSGDIIGIINADDWYESNTLKEVDKIFSRDSQVQILVGGIRLCRYDGTEIEKKIFNDGDPWKGVIWGHPSTFVRKTVYDVMGLFDSNYKIAADYKWLLSCYMKGIIFTYTSEILANFRETGISCKEERISADEQYRAKREVMDLLNIPDDEREKKRLEAEEHRDYAYGKWLIKTIPEEVAKWMKKKIPNIDKGIYLWGYGKFGKQFYELLKDENIFIRGIIDSSDSKRQFKVNRELSIKHPTGLEDNDATILVCIINWDNKDLGKQLINAKGATIVYAKELIIEMGRQYRLNELLR